jgi:hypothetical protein
MIDPNMIILVAVIAVMVLAINYFFGRRRGEKEMRSSGISTMLWERGEMRFLSFRYKRFSLKSCSTFETV